MPMRIVKQKKKIDEKTLTDQSTQCSESVNPVPADEAEVLRSLGFAVEE